jgi:hypothetical protein
MITELPYDGFLGRPIRRRFIQIEKRDSLMLNIRPTLYLAGLPSRVKVLLNAREPFILDTREKSCVYSVLAFGNDVFD